MEEKLREKLNEAKHLLNKNGFLVIRLGKGQIKIAKECSMDSCDYNNRYNEECVECCNKRCLKEIIKEQIDV